MKAPPNRKGNHRCSTFATEPGHGLNESPSQKEGKYEPLPAVQATSQASMKALPKRKGNPRGTRACYC